MAVCKNESWSEHNWNVIVTVSGTLVFSSICCADCCWHTCRRLSESLQGLLWRLSYRGRLYSEIAGTKHVGVKIQALMKIVILVLHNYNDVQSDILNIAICTVKWRLQMLADDKKWSLYLQKVRAMLKKVRAKFPTVPPSPSTLLMHAGSRIGRECDTQVAMHFQQPWFPSTKMSLMWWWPAVLH